MRTNRQDMTGRARIAALALLAQVTGLSAMAAEPFPPAQPEWRSLNSSGIRSATLQNQTGQGQPRQSVKTTSSEGQTASTDKTDRLIPKVDPDAAGLFSPRAESFTPSSELNSAGEAPLELPLDATLSEIPLTATLSEIPLTAPLSKPTLTAPLSKPTLTAKESLVEVPAPGASETAPVAAGEMADQSLAAPMTVIEPIAGLAAPFPEPNEVKALPAEGPAPDPDQPLKLTAQADFTTDPVSASIEPADAPAPPSEAVLTPRSLRNAPAGSKAPNELAASPDELDGLLSGMIWLTSIVGGVAVVSLWGLRTWLTRTRGGVHPNRSMTLVESLRMGPRCGLYLVQADSHRVLVGVEHGKSMCLMPLPSDFSESLQQVESDDHDLPFNAGARPPLSGGKAA